MILINFTHPLANDDLDEVEKLTNLKLEKVIEIRVQFSLDQPFAQQSIALIDQVGFSSREWQTKKILINPPSLNYITAAVLAEIHGRAGYFPPIVRLKPVLDSLPPVFEVAEIINLQKIRDDARRRR